MSLHGVVKPSTRDTNPGPLAFGEFKERKKGECPSIEAEAVTFLMLFNFSLDVFFSAVADMS
jgi:hypothetical protein